MKKIFKFSGFLALILVLVYVFVSIFYLLFTGKLLGIITDTAGIIVFCLTYAFVLGFAAMKLEDEGFWES